MTTNSLISKLHVLDWIAIAAFVVILLYLAYLPRRRNLSLEPTTAEYLVMGRTMTLPLFVATLVATWYGGILAVTQISFTDGIYCFVTQGVCWYGTYLIFALLLVPKIRRGDPLSLPDMIQQRVGPRSAQVSAVFNILNLLPIVYVSSLGWLLNTLFQIPFLLGVGAATAIVIAYSSFGGFRSVVYSDMIQFVGIFLAVGTVLFFAWSKFGGIDYLRANLPATHFEPLGKYGVTELLIWAALSLSTLVDPNFHQRCFAAKSDRVARRGILLAVCFWFLLDIATTLGGMYARAALPFAEAGTAYLSFALDLLPTGLRGLFVGAILIAIISTIDSFVFIAAITLSRHLSPRAWVDSRLWQRCMIALVALASLGFAQLFAGNAREIWRTLGSYSAACLLFPVLMAHVFPGKIGDHDFAIASVFGAFAMTVAHVYPVMPEPFFIGIFSTALVLLVCVLLRRQGKSPNRHRQTNFI